MLAVEARGAVRDERWRAEFANYSDQSTHALVLIHLDRRCLQR